MILLEVIKVKNVWFAIIGFLIPDSRSKILYAMVVITWQC